MHSERPKLYAILVFLSAIGLTGILVSEKTSKQNANRQWTKRKKVVHSLSTKKMDNLFNGSFNSILVILNK